MRSYVRSLCRLVPELCRLVPTCGGVVAELLEVVVISHLYHRILKLRLGDCLVFVDLG